MNHKRVLGMMRKDNLLALRRGRFVVTTNSNHKFEVHLNLARRMKLSGVDQLWVADITYIRLQAEFVYLAVILDAFSRKVVGWALDRMLANRLTIAAPGAGHRATAAATWFGSSFRPWTAICARRICGGLGEVRNDSKHEPPCQPV